MKGRVLLHIRVSPEGCNFRIWELMSTLEELPEKGSSRLRIAPGTVRIRVPGTNELREILERVSATLDEFLVNAGLGELLKSVLPLRNEVAINEQLGERRKRVRSRLDALLVRKQFCESFDVRDGLHWRVEFLGDLLRVEDDGVFKGSFDYCLAEADIERNTMTNDVVILAEVEQNADSLLLGETTAHILVTDVRERGNDFRDGSARIDEKGETSQLMPEAIESDGANLDD